MKIPRALFRIGRLVATPNAMEKLQQADILGALRRHQAGDWGDVNDEDCQANNLALREMTRIFSVYHSFRNLKFWIITEADRSVTTVLMPEDY